MLYFFSDIIILSSSFQTYFQVEVRPGQQFNMDKIVTNCVTHHFTSIKQVLLTDNTLCIFIKVSALNPLSTDIVEWFAWCYCIRNREMKNLRERT